VFQGVVFAQGLIVTLILVAVILRKRPDAYVFFVGWIMVLAGIVHDILVTSGVMHSGIQITPYLMFLFIFVQANVVARRSSQAFLQVEQLSDRLNFVNLNLEKMVSERTRRIERQNIEMERQTRKIDRQNVELQKTINVRNQVLTIIGHDLRSPIGNISEMVDLLLNDTLDDETQMQILYTIKQAATGSFTLLENLMYWGRAQSGRISNHPELSSLHNSVEEALHLLMPGAREKNITLENSVSPDQMAWCDPVHLNLVFRNLINNAIKFTPEGGRVNISSRILQDKRNNSEFVEVSVRDNGVGIPPEKLGQIFTSDTIESTWGTNNEKGSGIGLQLVKQFITINHGQVYARSKVGEFTAFIFSLPLKETR
ncbi:MAG: HAMP domain-containing sensor histidine kinase, partial [Bacteroidales bacterium]|nr:HAMP domain-containing sensor histidine kinase [Bacteroidales bacterium]HPE87855.1 HAMP domain-containing sensor histidine kinase [Bacteroidales bacterium]